MEFIKALKESRESKEFKNSPFLEEDKELRIFKSIPKKDVSLSIQASFSHYCTPRKTLKDLTEYTSMEFALIKESEFIRVQDILPNFSRLNEIESYCDTVYAFVPVDLIEDLYKEYFA